MGYATTMMKKTGRAMRLDINHRSSKIYTLERNQCVCAVEEVCPDLQKPEPKSLDRAGVVRDVENDFVSSITKSCDVGCFNCSHT